MEAESQSESSASAAAMMCVGLRGLGRPAEPAVTVAAACRRGSLARSHGAMIIIKFRRLNRDDDASERHCDTEHETAVWVWPRLH